MVYCVVCRRLQWRGYAVSGGTSVPAPMDTGHQSPPHIPMTRNTAPMATGHQPPPHIPMTRNTAPMVTGHQPPPHIPITRSTAPMATGHQSKPHIPMTRNTAECINTRSRSLTLYIKIYILAEY